MLLRTRPLLLVCLALTLSACAPFGEATLPPPSPQQIAGEERLRNGGFEAGLEGWTLENEADAPAPQAIADFAHDGAQGVRSETAEGSAGVSALIGEFAPASSYTLQFWFRPQRGSNRVGLQDTPERSGRSASRVLFIDAGESSSALVYTAWDVNAVLRVPLEIGRWYNLRVTVDGERGTQTFTFNGDQVLTLASENSFPAAALVFGDRQPRTDQYRVMFTDVEVRDGLNGSYDYDDFSLKVTE